jgi:hypothetical protein
MQYARHEFSSVGDLVNVLQEMHNRSEDFCLDGDDEDTWIIASYDPRSKRYYVSTCLPTDTEYMEIYDPAMPHKRIEAVIGGQLTDSWDDSLVSFEVTKSAFVHFFQHQSRDPLLLWRTVSLSE